MTSATDPSRGWGGRRYRPRGHPERRQIGPVWGVAIPVRRPAIWLEVAMATLAAGCAWAMAYGVLRLLRGDGDGKAVLGIVILAALARSSLRRPSGRIVCGMGRRAN